MRLTIRAVTSADAPAIAAIHNQGIEDRQATFETRPRTPEEIAAQIEEARELPFLVAERDGAVAGWARLWSYSDRECYAGVGEASIYIERSARGAGVGRALLDALAETARQAGYWKLIGLLFPENAASVALFKAAGGRDVGVHRRHGQLDGRWRDVAVVELLLDQRLTAPSATGPSRGSRPCRS